MLDKPFLSAADKETSFVFLTGSFKGADRCANFLLAVWRDKEK